MSFFPSFASFEPFEEIRADMEDNAAAEAKLELDRWDMWSKGFAGLSNNTTLSDITIEYGDRRFHAHKVILAAHSDYIRAMFTRNDFAESNQSSITLLEDDEQALQTMFSWMYDKSVLPIFQVQHDFDAERIDRLDKLFTVADKYGVHGLAESTIKEMLLAFIHGGEADGSRQHVSRILRNRRKAQPGSLAPYRVLILASMRAGTAARGHNLQDYRVY